MAAGKRHQARSSRSAAAGPGTLARRHPERARPGAPRRPWWRGWAPMVAVIAAVVVAVTSFLILGRQGPPAPPPPPSAATQIAYQASHVSDSVLTGVGGAGLVSSFKGQTGVQPLTGGSGKPELLYLGAEFCPYCAAERWSLVVALSRFGTLSGLELNRSSASDVYPNTPTFTFRAVKFSSPYLEFAAVEMRDRNGNTLQTPDAVQSALAKRYDPSLYIPFIDVGNRYTAVGGWTPNMMQGEGWQQVAGDLGDPSAASTRAIVGHANHLIAAICQITGQRPGSVCSAPYVQQLESKLGG